MSANLKERHVYDPAWWGERLKRAIDNGQLHQAVFNTSEEIWNEIGAKHMEELAKHLAPSNSILDVGCGYGRLLELMPDKWYGGYVGIDLAAPLLDVAKKMFPSRCFIAHDLRESLFPILGSIPQFDWGICVSVKRVVIGKSGEEQWEKIENQLKAYCKRIMYLDYDPSVDAEILEMK